MAIFGLLNKFSILGFLKKNIIYILIILILFGVIYGYFKYQERVVYSLVQKIEEKDNVIKKLENEKASLQFNLDVLNMANNNLRNEIKRKEKEYTKAIESFKRVNRLLENSNKRLRVLEDKIRKNDRRNIMKNLKDQNEAIILLIKENEFLKCYVENFNNVEENCLDDKINEKEFKKGKK